MTLESSSAVVAVFATQSGALAERPAIFSIPFSLRSIHHSQLEKVDAVISQDSLSVARWFPFVS